MNLVLLNPMLRSDDSHSNTAAIERLMTTSPPAPDDIVLLPERFSFDDDPDSYDAYLRKLAAAARCTVVGGSHIRRRNGRMVNFGRAVNPRGEEIATYTKLRPYFNERERVSPGDEVGEFTIG